MQNQRKKVAAPKQHSNNRRYLWRDFLRHLEFLKISGYVTKEGVLTDDGVWASQLRVDQPLMIAEGFRLGVMPVSDPALLAAIIASFAYEREADDNIDKTLLPGILLAAALKAKKGLRVFAKNMAVGKFEVRPLFLRPAVAIYAWASGQPWEKVLSVAEMEEGIMAMLILRTADNLRHIRALRHDFPEAAQTAAAAIELILKDPVQIGW